MRQSSKNRLSALSGFPVKDATVEPATGSNEVFRGLSTGNRTGKPAAREQEILTPQCIVDVANKLWGRILFDPCWCEGALTNPVYKRTSITNGLDPDFKWWPRCYINPPYSDLKQWLEHGRKQLPEQIWLVPVRTHRTWWRQWRDSLDAYCELNPIAFFGFDQVFPAPLLLGYRGAQPEDFLNAIQIGGGLYEKRC